jgi:RNA recognition motif-containing protein
MNLTLSNLNKATTEAELRSVLEEFGPIGEISLHYLSDNHLQAYVKTLTEETGDIILRYLSGDLINGQALEISRGEQKLIKENAYHDQLGTASN